MSKITIISALCLTSAAHGQVLTNGGFENTGGLAITADSELNGAGTYKFADGEVLPGWGIVDINGVNDVRFVYEDSLDGNFNNPEGDGFLYIGGAACVFARNATVGPWAQGTYTFTADISTWNIDNNGGLTDRPFRLEGRYLDASGNLLGSQFVINPSTTDPNYTWDSDPAYDSWQYSPGNVGYPSAKLNWKTITTTFDVDYTTAPAGAVGFDLFVTAGATSSNTGQLLDNVTLTADTIPEPSSSLLLGLAGLGFLARRKR